MISKKLLLNGCLKPLRALGSGATGIVFLARSIHEEIDSAAHVHTAEPRGAGLVAVKAFRRTRERDLLQSQNEEAILSLVPPHPFLPCLHAAFDSEGFRFLALDFCAGGDLHDLRKSLPDHRFSPSAIRFYAAEIVLALQHLHSHGVVYRDLKPENILLTGEGHVKLTDFDLAARLPPKSAQRNPLRQADEISRGRDTNINIASDDRSDRSVSCLSVGRKSRRGRAQHRLQKVVPAPGTPPESHRFRLSTSATKLESCASVNHDLCSIFAEHHAKSHSFVGTEEYVAPEMVDGAKGHDFAVDWWALGVLLYEMAYGKTPFKGPTSNETFHNILHNEVLFPGCRSSTTPSLPMSNPSKHQSMTTYSAQLGVLQDLIAKLLVKEPCGRLGFWTDANEVQAHPFFSGVHWDTLHHIARPPFVPFVEPLQQCSSSQFKDIEVQKDEQCTFDLMSHLLEVERARDETRTHRRNLHQEKP